MPRKTTKNDNDDFSKKLILFRFFLHLMGRETLKDFSAHLNSDEAEGLDENHNTKFYCWITDVLCGSSCKIPKDKLRIYDENICRHIRQIGENRGGLILKYFQYISLLFTEYYLDNYFNRKLDFVSDLNDFINQTMDLMGAEPFSEKDLNKLAYMCATGSGKTLIMHVNILQFNHYFLLAQQKDSSLSINKIILLAPNENLAQQHIDELKLSNIPAGIFYKGNQLKSAEKIVTVIDMNKLREEGKEKTVSVDQFEQNNLVLVDEGHRGMSGSTWIDFRSRLSAEGFSFEYSATFKQALSSGNATEKKELLKEYSKSIIMDYSYKYFYEDGYGKEYRIYNLKDGIQEDTRQLYLVGCLLSFYQQMKVFQSNQASFSPYQIEKPLLIFVGNRVSANTTKSEMTDIEEVICFFDAFLRNKEKSVAAIKALFQDDTGLIDANGNELFQGNFQPLKDTLGLPTLPNPEETYNDILKIVFNSQSVADSPRIQMINLKQVQGEIALRVGSNGDFFGVINIGDTLGLMKQCEKKMIVTRNDEFISSSFFRSINEKNSGINVLVGSRKFTEGWNCWRVSTMGLINFAKNEGSQAIQLFGRGVRLHGYNGCLKRSNRLHHEKTPKHLSCLETLTIFGIKAQYMEDFKKYLMDEGAPLNDNNFEFKLPVISRASELRRATLKVLRLPKDKNFKKQARRLILDEPDEGLLHYLARSPILIDCRAKVQTIESAESVALKMGSETETHKLPLDSLDFLNYSKIFQALEQYKTEKYYYNICLDINKIKPILKSEIYSLIIPENQIIIDSMDKLIALNDYAIMVLQSYMDKFFKYHKDKWESPYLSYQDMSIDDANFVKEYTITYIPQVPDDPNIKELESFLSNLENILKEKKGIPSNIDSFQKQLFAFDFRFHLYAPLICVKSKGLQIQVTPVALNSDEMNFVEKLKEFTETHKDDFKDTSFFLLRNKSKTGLGFFEADNFYPDFILWLDTPTKQFISFIDPKGLLHVPWNSNKIMFYEKIKERELKMSPSSGKKIVLNSFIMCGTDPTTLMHWWPETKGKDEWLTRNVMCLQHKDCIENMFKKIFEDKD